MPTRVCIDVSGMMLLQLARAPIRMQLGMPKIGFRELGERGRNRTFNLLIKSQSSALLSCCRDTPYPLASPHFGVFGGVQSPMQSNPTAVQSLSENDFESLANTGLSTPETTVGSS